MRMLFKKDELRILWPFYLYYLVFGLSIMIMPFMIIYFRNLGFSFFQIAVMTSAFGISTFLFEIPTGAFADGFSRKCSVILGLIISGIAVILIPLFTSFYIIFLLWFLAGIGITFMSGAEESWVIDNLNHHKREDLHHEFFVKSYSLSSLGLVFAPLIGAVLVKNYSISILWLIFGFGFLLSALVLAVFGRELYKPKRVGVIEALKETYNTSKVGLRFTYSHKVVFLLVLGSVLLTLMFMGENGWQPFLVQLSLPQHDLGFVYSAMAAIMVISPFLSKLLVRMKVKNVISIIILVRMILLLSLIFIYPPLYFIAATIFVLDSGFSALKEPLLQAYIHKFIPTKIRATVISVKSMVVQISLALGALIGGALMDVWGPQKIIALGGLFGVFAIATYLKIKD